MIAMIEGEIKVVENDSVIVMVSGVGYRVYIVGFNCLVGDSVSLFIYDHIREDRRDLYGFKDDSVLKLFEKLIDISGVGTKLAQKILNSYSADILSNRILEGDIVFLTGISGVGKKTAQKIILELKGVLVSTDEAIDDDLETLEALMSLGYMRSECIKVIEKLKTETIDERIKEALKILGR